jgi:polar amino acid transport system permease protein
MLPGAPKIGPTTATIMVLSLVGSAYGAEIVRAGIAAVHKGQNEACHALSLSRKDTLFKVVLPQALSQIVPAYGSMARDLIKWTSIVSFVGVQDVLYAANSVRVETYETTKVFVLLALTYYMLTLICGLLFKASEMLLPMNRALRAMAQTRTQGATGSEGAA